jgi:hypothetical protein
MPKKGVVTYRVTYENAKGEMFYEKPTFNAMTAIETAKTLLEIGKKNINIRVSKYNETIMGVSNTSNSY